MKKRRRLILLVIFLLIVIVCKVKPDKKELLVENEVSDSISEPQNEIIDKIEAQPARKEINDWRLVLVNHENALPSDFQIELAPIDKIREFDARAIGELKQMLGAMKEDGITNVWVQSAYRSVERQQDLFVRKISEYEAQGMSKEEAEELAIRKLNKPGTSEHNLGLAVDFNYVEYDFDQTKGFHWLEENAQNYGFILRYAKEKEAITQVDYEPWHWRYVGAEHALKMNELNLCLEEYVAYSE